MDFAERMLLNLLVGFGNVGFRFVSISFAGYVYMYVPKKRTYFDVIGQFYGHSETLCFLQKEMCLTSGFFPLIVYQLSTCSTCRRKQIVEFKIVRAWIVRDGFRIFNFTRKTAFLKQIR